MSSSFIQSHNMTPVPFHEASKKRFLVHESLSSSYLVENVQLIQEKRHDYKLFAAMLQTSADVFVLLTKIMGSFFKRTYKYSCLDTS